ncbi:hypothetical protein QVD17_35058 [Tagetes erecta]|uniref:Uncharacterized protein n=1 Tax=Tagetes erecta TaxID=13708 RepID=A0AAD8K1E2_TARER|nr:hypothetical protein QVD17_35058 [Tagetes erecta]
MDSPVVYFVVLCVSGSGDDSGVKPLDFHYGGNDCGWNHCSVCVVMLKVPSDLLCCSHLDSFGVLVLIHLHFLDCWYCDVENVIRFVGVMIVSNGETEKLLLC